MTATTNKNQSSLADQFLKQHGIKKNKEGNPDFIGAVMDNLTKSIKEFSKEKRGVYSEISQKGGVYSTLSQKRGTCSELSQKGGVYSALSQNDQ